jgi:hypothetical protein
MRHKREKVYIGERAMYKWHVYESFLVKSCPAGKTEVDANMTVSKNVNYYKKKRGKTIC